MWSRQSRRTLPRKRSQKALALACPRRASLFGVASRRTTLRSIWAVHSSVGDRITPKWTTCREPSSILNKNEKPSEEQVVHGPEFDAAEEPIASPHLLRVVVQKRFPVLTGPTLGGICPESLHHILLNGRLAHTNVQLQRLFLNALGSPQMVFESHSLCQHNCFSGQPGFLHFGSGLPLPNRPKPCACQPTKVSR